MDNIITNRKCKRDIQFRYILNAIKKSGIEFANHREMLYWLAEQYATTNCGRDLATWLQEQNAMSIAKDREQIKTIGTAWGYCRTASSAEKFADNWFKMLAFRINQMCEILK